MTATYARSTALLESLQPGALLRRRGPKAARRIPELVNYCPRRGTPHGARFCNKQNELRNDLGAGVGELSSAASTYALTPSPSPSLSSSYSPSTQQRELQETPHANDNVERHSQHQNDNAKSLTTPKKNVAARVLKLFRALEVTKGNRKVYAFTLNIDQEDLLGRENPTTWMQHRIARRLEEFLGRKVTFVGVMEWRRKLGNELHVHGGITLAPEELPLASDALRAAGGRWSEGQGIARQVDLGPVDASKSFKGAFGIDGWALYCADDSRQTQLELNRRRSGHFHRAPEVIMKSNPPKIPDTGITPPDSDAKNRSHTQAPISDVKIPPLRMKTPDVRKVSDVAKISDTTKPVEDLMGRHKEEIGTAITVRMRRAELSELDNWISAQTHEGLNRPKAIRRLIGAAIRGVTNSASIYDATKPEIAAEIRDATKMPALESRIAELEAENAELRRQLTARIDTPVMQAALLGERSPQAPADLPSAAISDSEPVPLIPHDDVFPSPAAVHATAPARAHVPLADLPYDAPVAAMRPEVASEAKRKMTPEEFVKDLRGRGRLPNYDETDRDPVLEKFLREIEELICDDESAAQEEPSQAVEDVPAGADL